MLTWLSLVDYANKYKVSISTLRRKIKLEDIPFRLDSGKYYIVDEPLRIIGASQGNQMELVKPQVSISEKPNEKPSLKSKIETPVFPPQQIEIPETESAKARALEGGESILVAANRLLDEIKKAYTLILQEKDEQVRQLREEISDLKTLVRVLEGETERLNKENAGKEGLFFE